MSTESFCRDLVKKYTAEQCHMVNTSGLITDNKNMYCRNSIIYSCLFAVLLLLVQVPVAHAEEVYISDRLRVGVRPEPGQQYAPINVVVTGMKLKVLARKDGFIKIRSESGIEGWIRDIYAVDKPPAELRLKKLEKAHAKLKQELNRANETVKAMEDAQTVLNEQIDRLKAQRAELQRNQAVLIASDPDRGFWWFMLVLVGVAGVVLGYLWHRYQTMRRLGGLRI